MENFLHKVGESFKAEGDYKGEKILGGIVGAVAVAGVGYLGYQEWLKHHNKEHSEEAAKEFQAHGDYKADHKQ